MFSKKGNKKVLVVATGPSTKGGITSVISAYTKTSLWRDWECYWLATHIDGSLAIKLWCFLKSYIQFWYLLPRYDIVHIHFSEYPSAIRKSLFFVTAKLWNKAIVVHFHAFSVEKTTEGKFSGLYRFLFSNADLVLALSKFWKQNILHNTNGKANVQILYNPVVKSELLEPSSQQKSISPYILFAGTLNDRKGYSDLIKAFINLAKEYPVWQLVLAGGIASSGILEEIILGGLENRIVFPGWVSGAFKDTLFNNASIFCLPSYQEGLPMAVLDAMSFGVPVITTPVGAMPDVFTHKENVLFVRPGNVAELTASLRILIESESLRYELGHCAQDFTVKNFEIGILSKQLDDMYLALVSGHTIISA